MANPLRLLLLALACGWALNLQASPPPLLAKAFEQWATGRDELAFTQRTRFLFDDGTVKSERVERFDPSLPDRQRWRLISVDGQPATDEQRKKWETNKNKKPRKKVAKQPSDYVDLEHAVLVDDNADRARYEIRLRREAARLLGVEKIAAILTVDKKSGSIVHITADLKEPMRVLLGLAKITDLDVDVHIEPIGDETAASSGAVQTGSIAHVAISELGNPMEYQWSDFTRVEPYRIAMKQP